METSNIRNWHTAGKGESRNLHGVQKIQYIWDYYKIPIVICAIILYIAAHFVYGRFEHKDVIMYTALVNVNAGEDLTKDLSSNFLESRNFDTAKNELYLYSGLYLSDDENNAYHEYTDENPGSY